jgi:hypothetical protein
VIWLIVGAVWIVGAAVGWAVCARAGQLDDAAGMGDGIHYFSYYCTRWDCVAELPSRAALDRHLVDHEPVVPADDILAGCNLCPPGEPYVPDAELVDHLRLLHPDAWGDGPELWPDGEVVVADLTLEPDDFGGER